MILQNLDAVSEKKSLKMEFCPLIPFRGHVTKRGGYVFSIADEPTSFGKVSRKSASQLRCCNYRAVLSRVVCAAVIVAATVAATVARKKRLQRVLTY